MNTTSTYRIAQHATPNMEHRFQYDLALLAGGSATVSVQQLVGNSYQNLPSTQIQTVSGTYTLAFEPTEETIRIVVASTNRFALTNLTLDRDHVDTLVESYALHAGGYRYGFNGMEMDDEVKGRGNSYDFGARMYDSRLGRFLSIDRFKHMYPNFSNYSISANNPINIIDINGDSLYILVNNIPLNIFSEEGRIEFNKLGINLLLNTTEGKVLIEKYANSTRHDVYVAITDIPSEENGTIGALTINTHLRPEDQGATTLPKEFSIFEGLKLKNKKVTYSLMVINNDLVSFEGKFADPSRFQYLDLPETFYHELKSHVDFSKFSYKKANGNGKEAGKIQHKMYGVEHNNSLGIKGLYMPKGENDKTPYSVIVDQLKKAQFRGEKYIEFKPKETVK